MICEKCGNDFEGKFCNACGAPADSNRQNIEPEVTVLSQEEQAKYQQNQQQQQYYQQQQYQQNQQQQYYQQQPQYQNVYVNNMGGRMPTPKNKWVAFLLCIFFGILGIHKFYEGRILLGVVYLLTGGLCGIGVLVDFFVILFKPNPYYI